MTILNEIPIYTIPDFYISRIFICLALLLFGGIGTGIFLGCNLETPGIICAFLVLGSLIGVVFFLITGNCNQEFHHYNYQVILDDNITAKELLNDYEIISHEGEIFTVKEIEEEN